MSGYLTEFRKLAGLRSYLPERPRTDNEWLEEGKKLPTGTKRKWKGGTYQKQGDGSWKLLPVKPVTSTPSGAPPKTTKGHGKASQKKAKTTPDQGGVDHAAAISDFMKRHHANGGGRISPPDIEKLAVHYAQLPDDVLNHDRDSNARIANQMKKGDAQQGFLLDLSTAITRAFNHKNKAKK